MNFFSLSLCKELTAAGLKSESGFWHQATYSHPLGYECRDCEKNRTSDGDIAPHPCAWHIAYRGDGEGYDIPAFTAFDLCGPSEQARENAKILWPNDGETNFLEPGYYPHGAWNHTHRHALIDLKEDEVEEYVRKSRVE